MHFQMKENDTLVVIVGVEKVGGEGGIWAGHPKYTRENKFWCLLLCIKLPACFSACF